MPKKHPVGGAPQKPAEGSSSAGPKRNRKAEKQGRAGDRGFIVRDGPCPRRSPDTSPEAPQTEASSDRGFS